MIRGCFPGSFDPPTVAHIEIARVAIAHLELDRLDLCISRAAIGKRRAHAPIDVRVEVLSESLAALPEARVRVTDEQFIVDIASGYDAVVMGADKWRQVNDPAFYDDDQRLARRAVDALPAVAVVARPPDVVPPGAELLIDATELVDGVSSTRARRGDHGVMTDPARRAARDGRWWI